VQFSDAYYVAHIIGALGCALVSTTPPEKVELQGDHIPQMAEDPRVQVNNEIMNAALAEVDRYRDMDRVIPSWRNVITVATLEVRLCVPPCSSEAEPPTPVQCDAHDGK
jgi:transcription initiation factor TFIID subunit 2